MSRKDHLGKMEDPDKKAGPKHRRPGQPTTAQIAVTIALVIFVIVLIAANA